MVLQYSITVAAVWNWRRLVYVGRSGIEDACLLRRNLLIAECSFMLQGVSGVHVGHVAVLWEVLWSFAPCRDRNGVTAGLTPLGHPFWELSG
jgi:hypothetical protein